MYKRQCKEYIYDSNIEALTNINERFFDNENWYIRLILEGEDRLVKNQEVRNGKKTISYSAVAEDWNELREEDSTLAHLILCEMCIRDRLLCRQRIPKQIKL